MKKFIGVVVLSLALAGSAWAHCGMCGVGGEKAKGHAAAGEHAGASCPMHGEKNATLLEAAGELEVSKPELAAKLKDMAAHCCGSHS